MSVILRLVFVVAGLLTALFVARDALNFELIQTWVAVRARAYRAGDWKPMGAPAENLSGVRLSRPPSALDRLLQS